MILLSVALFAFFWPILVGEPILTGDYAHLPPKIGVSALTSALQEALGNVINETSSAESLRVAISD